MKISRPIDTVFLLLLSLLAWKLTMLAGLRGLFAFDQSVIFDAAYRIFSGQVPYKDFVMLHGFLAAAVQSLFFLALGVDYGAYVGGAAVLNVLAALLSVAIVRLFFPGRKILSYAAGLLTAVWFYPPFGTPWGKQTAFLFGMAGVYCLARAALEESAAGWRVSLVSRGASFAFLSGLSVFSAFLSYQGAGSVLAIFLVLFVVALALVRPEKGALCLGGFGAGLAFGAAAAFAWALIFSDAGQFWKYMVELPMLLGKSRSEPERWGRFFEALFMGFTGWRPQKPMLIPPPVKWLPLWIRLCLLVFYAASLAMFLRAFINKNADGFRTAAAAALALALVHFQYAFMYVNLNHPMNGLPFVGVISAIGLGFLTAWAGPMDAPGSMRRNAQMFCAAGSAAAVLALAAAGFSFSMKRTEHPSFRISSATFGAPLADEKLRGLRWGRPTIITQILPEGRQPQVLDLTEEDFLKLLARLRADDRNFFVFPDFAILYGLTGKPSPQPLLWFHKGTIYTDTYDAALDRWIVDDLIRNRVELALLEEESYHGTGERLADFPLLKIYLESNFRPVERIGIFNIHEKIKK